MRSTGTGKALAASVFAVSTLVATVLAGTPAAQATGGQQPAKPPALSGAQTEYLVLANTGVGKTAAEKAVKAAGGQLVKANAAPGSYLAKAPANGFVSRIAQQKTLLGAVPNKPIGSTSPTSKSVAKAKKIERPEGPARGTGLLRRGPGAPDPEPLANRQWDMQQIGATATGSYAHQRGNKKVLVGVIDSGIDAKHPDIAPNFNRKLSKNFTTDMPLIDGPCEYANCVDPADVDGQDHGTHVASTIAAPLNGRGIAGVAPNVSLVNLRAGQDDGHFFLGPVLDALFTAGDLRINVVNMSFYVDPWLFNCTNNPKDSPENQLAQRTIRTAVQRALDYASSKGVVLVNSLGNEQTDLGNPKKDATSPNFPPKSEYERTIDNSCISMPGEGEGNMPVASLGPSLRKSYFSNYGTEQNEISAPGGDSYDTPDGKSDVTRAVLAALPESAALADGVIDKPGGEPKKPSVIRECKDGTCAYYQYLQGTSMAAPHVTGTVALIFAQFGIPNGKGGVALPPNLVKKRLFDSATKKACPNPRDYHYVVHRPDGTLDFTHRCEGGLAKNGFYGRGIVNANSAVTAR